MKKIKMLIMDVDGVMTDCRVWMDSNGQWKRFFFIRDGVGILRIQDAGYKTAVITGSTTDDIRARVKNLGINYFFENASDKAPAFEKLIQESGLKPEEMAYIGDELADLPILERVAFSATVPEAVEAVKNRVHYITRCGGGAGAVREICDYIFDYGALSQGKNA